MMDDVSFFHRLGKPSYARLDWKDFLAKLLKIKVQEADIIETGMWPFLGLGKDTTNSHEKPAQTNAKAHLRRK